MRHNLTWWFTRPSKFSLTFLSRLTLHLPLSAHLMPVFFQLLKCFPLPFATREPTWQLFPVVTWILVILTLQLSVQAHFLKEAFPGFIFDPFSKPTQRHHFANNSPYSQGYGLSSSHLWMWELNHKGRALKNWCFQTVVLKTLESPLDSKEIKPVNPKGNQPWIFIGRTDAETPILWPPDVKSRLIGKDPEAGKDRKQEKGTTDNKMVGWHHWLNGHEFDQTPGDGEGQESLVYCSPRGHKESDMTERLDSNYKIRLHKIKNFFLFRDEDCRIFIKMTDSFESFILSDELSLENRKNLIFQGWGRENWSALHKIAHQGLS